MTGAEMRDTLVELGYPAIYAAKALRMTNSNIEEAKELLDLSLNSNMHLAYEVLKLTKRVGELEKLLVKDKGELK